MITEVPPTSQETPPAALSSVLLRELVLIAVISVFVLIPCLWHSHIEAGDLGSHVYNAWLAQLIAQGKAPGLYIVRKWDNVLFDLMLYNFANLFGIAVAEKLATCLCALIFFWGVFALMRAISSQAPWYITPCIAMLTYGQVFHSGFINYYLSLGLASLALALLWPVRRNGVTAAILLMPVILLAHPIGLLWFAGVAGYRLLWLALPNWSKWLLPLAAIGVCAMVSWYVWHHPNWEVQPRELPGWRMTGANQFHVFGPTYRYFTQAILVVAAVSTALAMFRSSRRGQFWKDRLLPLELYVVSFAATVVLPENILTDPTGGWIGELASRLTLITGIFLLCWLATLPARRWHVIAYSLVALAFFVQIYRDTAFLSRMEDNAERVTRTLPFGTRVLATVHAPSDFRTWFLHIPDRACIGHCFLFSNYEPSTRQFRIRVHEGSPVVTASVDDSDDMQSGNYDVQEEDLPLKQIYQCDGRDLTQICIRDLAEDEKNGRIGYRAAPN